MQVPAFVVYVGLYVCSYHFRTWYSSDVELSQISSTNHCITFGLHIEGMPDNWYHNNHNAASLISCGIHSVLQILVITLSGGM